MRGLLSISSIIFIWLLVCIFLLFGVLAIFSKISSTKSLNVLLVSTSKNIFNSPEELALAPREVLAAVRAEDARPVLVERFLRENGSPMKGMGEVFIQASEKYNLDWRLLPAIAFQESSVGKKTPFGSYNAFGWGVIDGTGKGTNFQSWENAIFSVAKGLRENYLNKGLATPEEINPFYAGDKNWNVKVKFAMELISQ